MWKLLKSLLGQPGCPEESSTQEWTIRGGKSVPVDEVFRATNSGDLGRMVRALRLKTHPVDRHFLLMAVVKESYRLRADPKMADLCADAAQTHVAEFRELAPALKREFDGSLPRVSTFQHFATLLTERGEFERAVGVCEKAIAFGLDDGTKGGFQGRIKRIQKKAARESK